MTIFKKILIAMLSAMLIVGMIPMGALAENYTDTYTLTVPTAEAENGGDELLIKIGTISDSHVDYNIQNKEPYIRNAFITAVNALKGEDLDLFLVGGDMTSDNQDKGGKYRWEHDVYDRTIAQYLKYSSQASKSGITLWACGNHDQEVGFYENTLSTGDYNSYEGFMNLMLATAGYPISLYTKEDDAGVSLFSDHWLGAHYNIKGFDFIVINGGYQVYSAGTLEWLDNTLSEIGADKTVFIMGHYPLQDNRGVTNPGSYGMAGDAQESFKKVMNKYDNAIYVYGHNHGTANGNVPWIMSDVFERITHYDANGAVVNDRNTAPSSFITAFMGSAGYYDGSLGEADPLIIQAMTISVYTNRIEFKMINCGAQSGTLKEPAVWTINRNVKSSGAREESGSILVTEDVNDNVYYGSALGINKFKMPSNITSLSYDGVTIEAEGLEGLNLTAKRLGSGTKYKDYMTKLSDVVNTAVLFDCSAKKLTRPRKIETPVKVTMPALIGEFGSKTAEIDLAAYYWNNDGELCMTDVKLNEDGTISFIMTNLSSFALSERANATDQLTELKDNNNNSGNDDKGKNDGKDNDNSMVMIILIVVAVVVVATVAVIIVVKKSKANKTEKNNGKQE
nr:metallophosphoesterase [Clostridia bacterium]